MVLIKTTIFFSINVCLWKNFGQHEDTVNKNNVTVACGCKLYMYLCMCVLAASYITNWTLLMTHNTNVAHLSSLSPLLLDRINYFNFLHHFILSFINMLCFYPFSAFFELKLSFFPVFFQSSPFHLTLWQFFSDFHHKCHQILRGAFDWFLFFILNMILYNLVSAKRYKKTYALAHKHIINTSSMIYFVSRVKNCTCCFCWWCLNQTHEWCENKEEIKMIREKHTHTYTCTCQQFMLMHCHKVNS